MGSSAKGGGGYSQSSGGQDFASKFQRWQQQGRTRPEGGGEAAATGRQSPGNKSRDQVGPVERAIFDAFTGGLLDNDDKKAKALGVSKSDYALGRKHRTISQSGSLLDDDNDNEGGLGGYGNENSEGPGHGRSGIGGI